MSNDLLMEAWGLLANVSEGDWTKQTPEWQEAVVRWRDAFHASLPTPELPDRCPTCGSTERGHCAFDDFDHDHGQVDGCCPDPWHTEGADR